MDVLLNSLIKKTNNCTKIISNNNFIINYSKKLGRPLFSSYDIYPNQIVQLKFGRKSFQRDGRLDYDRIYQLDPMSTIFNGDMSRGHLCPSFIMSHDKSQNGSWASSYLMSNIVPQNRDFNCGPWKELEIQTYKFIKKANRHVRVIVGAANLEPEGKLINKNLIWFDTNTNFEYVIPNVFYQIIITDYETKCFIGFNKERQKVYPINFDILYNLVY